MMLNFITIINDFLWSNIILVLLFTAGIFFTFYLGFVQIRLLPEAIRALFSGSEANTKRISSFEALCTSLAQRVGTGNIAGVATAISYGGQGAIFWMWVTALLGASTSFAECTLAQVFKVKHKNGSFYGGPAYYIHAGLNSKFIATIFSICIIVAMGFVFNAVQSNTIAQGLFTAFSITPLWSGVFLALFSGFIIFGGQKRIAIIASKLVPFMAFFYILLTASIMLINLKLLPSIFNNIIQDAFTSKALIGGLVGQSIKEAIRHGIARGLYSNEAGWGSAPNAAASADVKHPVQQGLVQMLAVFIDTLLICTSTAMLILLAKDLDFSMTGIALTQMAAKAHLGSFGHIFIAFAIFLFGFTTILGNTFYSEANINFITKNPKIVLIFRCLVLMMVVQGALAEVPLVWQLADLMSAIMTLINLSSILLMAALVKKVSHHFSAEFLGPKQEDFAFSKASLQPKQNYNFAYDDNSKNNIDT